MMIGLIDCGDICHAERSIVYHPNSSLCHHTSFPPRTQTPTSRLNAAPMPAGPQTKTAILVGGWGSSWWVAKSWVTMDWRFGRWGYVVRFGGRVDGLCDDEESPETTPSCPIKSLSRSCNSIPSSSSSFTGASREGVVRLLLETYNSIPSASLASRYGKAHSASSMLFTAHTNFIVRALVWIPSCCSMRWR